MNKERIEQLTGQFPYLQEILYRWAYRGNIKPIIDIKVKRADENLLLFRGESIGLHYTGGLQKFVMDKDGHIGTLRQIMHAVDTKNVVLQRSFWSQENTEKVVEHFEPLLDQDIINHFILVEIYDYYIDLYQERPDDPFGDHISRYIFITIYQRPKIGFPALKARVDPVVNVKLRIKDIMRSALLGDPIYQNAEARIDELLKVFIAQVYVGGLKEVIDASTYKGMSGQFGSTTLMSFVMAGRILFTFKGPTANVIFIGADGEEPPNFGLQSIDATVPEARKIIYEVIQGWLASPLPPSERFKDDKNIGII